MDSKTKSKVRNRILTIISKIEELQQLGMEDSEINDILPCSIEGWSQELQGAYSELYS